jgi:2-oxoglutarate ferredoxin oxidoreductase subunit alpha
VLTTSSSPGISLMSEAISYIACCELPVVIVNIVRSGPGLGGILPAQSDYFQATRGIGHGDFRLIVMAPSSVQEAVSLIYEAFDLADEWRNPVMIIGDGMIGQMMEPVEFPPMRELGDLPEKPWAADGAKGRPPNIINSLFLDEKLLNAHNFKLKAKYNEIEKALKRFETHDCGKENDILVVSYGTMARICKTAIDEFKGKGGKAGLFRPISLWPFPYEALAAEARKVKQILVVEMSTGQMIEDVQMATCGRKKIEFFGKTGGMVPTPDEVAEKLIGMGGKGSAKRSKS